MSLSAGEDHDPVGLHDRVINHIFGSGLTLASILSLQRIDDDTAERLHAVIEHLDTAVRDLRAAAIGHVVGDRERASAKQASPLPAEWCRRLWRLTVDEVFAYAVGGHDFYRAGDHLLWAHESDGLLLSARSGRPLARREGKVFYDTETETPLYYEDPQTGRGSERSPDDAS